jgi:hypothetical protein
MGVVGPLDATTRATQREAGDHPFFVANVVSVERGRR